MTSPKGVLDRLQARFDKASIPFEDDGPPGGVVTVYPLSTGELKELRAIASELLMSTSESVDVPRLQKLKADIIAELDRIDAYQEGPIAKRMLPVEEFSRSLLGHHPAGSVADWKSAARDLRAALVELQSLAQPPSPVTDAANPRPQLQAPAKK